MAENAPAVPLLAEVVAGHLGVAPADLQLRRSTTGKFNTTYFIEGGPEPLVLRVAPTDDPSQMLFYEYRMMRQEPELHALLRARTDVPVPAILVADFSRERLDRDYLLMEQMLGVPLSEAAGLSVKAAEDILREVGRSLRQVHAITGDRYGYAGAHRPMEPQSDWPSAFEIMWHRLLDDIERCRGYAPAEAATMRRLFDRYQTVFDRPLSAALLHMDVWGQNILVGPDERLSGLIDWDRALWGDPEIEFAVLDYCGISEPSFWEGYGCQRDRSPEAEIRRAFYLLYELQKYIVIRRVRSGNAQQADAYRRQALSLAGQLPT